MSHKQMTVIAHQEILSQSRPHILANVQQIRELALIPGRKIQKPMMKKMRMTAGQTIHQHLMMMMRIVS